MFCSKCGKEIPEGNLYCVFCGSRVPADEETGQVETVRSQATPPSPPGSLTAAPAEPSGNKKIMLAAVLPFACLILIGGTVVLVLWAAVWKGGNQVRAEIHTIRILDEEGDEVDTDEVPLGENLDISVEYVALFPEDGEGKLRIEITGENDKSIAKKSVPCESSEQKQTYSYTLDLLEDMSELDFEVEVTLEVEDDKGLEYDDRDSLACTTEEGETTTTVEDDEQGDQELAEAFDKAAARIEEAINAVNDLINNGIDATGLTDLLDKAQFLLANGTTLEHLVGESDSALFYANYVINECNNRKQNRAQETAREQQPQPEPDYVVCPTCGGYGYIVEVGFTDYWVTCGTCGGLGGWFEYDEWGTEYWVTCWECGGSGGWWESGEYPVEVLCPTCGGTGWVVGIVEHRVGEAVSALFPGGELIPLAREWGNVASTYSDHHCSD